MRWCWVNLQCRGVLLIWIIVGYGPTALAVGAGGGCLNMFSLVYHFSFLSPHLWGTARYSLFVCGLAALEDSISVYIGPSTREREKMRERIVEIKNVKTTTPAPTASAIGPCPTIIQIVGRPGTEIYPGPSHHPTTPTRYRLKYCLKGPLSPKQPTNHLPKILMI